MNCSRLHMGALAFAHECNEQARHSALFISVSLFTKGE
jgi:hypothetical protein